jgi:hypothetical protein
VVLVLEVDVFVVVEAVDVVEEDEDDVEKVELDVEPLSNGVVVVTLDSVFVLGGDVVLVDTVVSDEAEITDVVVAWF